MIFLNNSYQSQSTPIDFLIREMSISFVFNKVFFLGFNRYKPTFLLSQVLKFSSFVS